MIGKRIRSLSQIFILSHLSLAPIVKLVPHRCEPFSTYPRTYDLLHADHLFTHYKIYGEGCLLEDIMLEMDRIIRPQGFIIIRDEESIVSRVRDLAPKFLWEVEAHELQDKYKKTETVLFCRKKFWAIL
jgi:hypothetical protein